MTIVHKISILAFTAAIAAGGASAKGHSQGVNNGDIEPGTQTGAKTVIDALTDAGALDGRGVSAAVKGGAQGSEASDGKGGKGADED